MKCEVLCMMMKYIFDLHQWRMNLRHLCSVKHVFIFAVSCSQTSICRFFQLFNQIIKPDRCNQAPRVQANQFVCFLKRIVSFSHCYRITDCDLPAPCNGWCGFEIRPQLSQGTLPCPHIRVSRRTG